MVIVVIGKKQRVQALVMKLVPSALLLIPGHEDDQTFSNGPLKLGQANLGEKVKIFWLHKWRVEDVELLQQLLCHYSDTAMVDIKADGAF